MKSVWGLLTWLVVILASCVTERITGTTDETATIAGKIRYADGKSASHALVTIFKDSAIVPSAKSVADNTGGYKFDSLDPGQYSVWAEGLDSVVAYADSIYVPKERQVVKNLTLEKSGSITAFVKMQPNHISSSVTVNALGTQKNANVDTAHSFTIRGLAPGEYTLRLMTTYPDYTPTFKTVTIESGKNETLSDTIELIFTGIPVVIGLNASFNMNTGVVDFKWNKTKYWDFQKYLIFRDLYDATSLSTQAIGLQSDTLFNDSLFKKGFFSDSDTVPVHLSYRIAIRNNAGHAGETYRFADVWGIPPSLLKMRFNYFIQDSIRPIMDTINIVGTFLSPYNTNVTSIEWKDLGTGVVIFSKILSHQTNALVDTLFYAPKKKGLCSLECMVRDDNERVWKDTITQYVVTAPAITDQPGNSEVAYGDSVMMVVAATGSQPLVCSWYKKVINAAHIVFVDSTNKINDSESFVSILKIQHVQFSDVGQYFCVVSNPFGSDTIDTVNVTIGTISNGFVQDANTLALYHFSESDSNILLDETEHCNGTLVSGNRCPGVFGNGLSFTPGQYAQFTCETMVPDGTPEGTIECYFAFDTSWDSSGSYAILGDNGARCLLLYKNGQIVFVKNHANIAKFIAGSIKLQPDRWYHLAGTWGHNGMRIFLDDQCIASNADYTGYQSSQRGISENMFYIGKKTSDGMEGSGIDTTSNFYGMIDEVRISDRARY